MIKAVIFDMFETLVSLFTCPQYQGKQVSKDAGIEEKKFREIWDKREVDRTLGLVTFEKVIEEILITNNRYSEELFKKIVDKRKRLVQGAFETYNDEVILLLDALKEKGIRIGLITNCFFEEKDAILNSSFYKYFDVVNMSCDLGIQKPDEKIFNICLDKLNLKADECLYVGDGGSYELETAKKLGMKTCQAIWYLNESFTQPVGPKNNFIQAKTPLEILSLLD